MSTSGLQEGKDDVRCPRDAELLHRFITVRDQDAFETSLLCVAVAAFAVLVPDWSRTNYSAHNRSTSLLRRGNFQRRSTFRA